MALTVHQTPQDYTPSDSPVTWTFSSTQTAQTNFYYEVGVYINDVLVKIEQVYPESGIYAKYDASAWASNGCTIPNIAATIDADAQNNCLVKISITERYGNPVIDHSTTTTANITAWKARLKDEDFVGWVADDYTFNGAETGKFWLTDFPTIQKVGIDEYVRLMAITDESDLDLTITLYNESGGVIASATLVTGASNKITIFNFSPSVIVSDTSISVSQMGAASYYIISEDNDRFEDYRFNIDTDCKYSTYKRIHFLSLFGAIEALSFNLISRERGNVTSFSGKKYWGQWDGNAFEYSLEQGQDVDHMKRVEKFLRVESDWVSEEVQQWLCDNLYPSPLVMIESTAGALLRRRITSTAFDKKIRENDTLFQEVIDIQLTTLESPTI